MNRRYRDFLKIRGRNLRDTLKILFNLSVHVVLRVGLQTRFRNRSDVIRWIEGHPEVYWTRFPFDLEGTILWNPWLYAWADPLSFHWCAWNDFPEDWFNVQEGEVVLDVGAHRGYWTLLVLRFRPSLVVAVEPIPENFGYLIRHLGINGVRNCIPVRAACWNRVEPVRLEGSHEEPERWTAKGMTKSGREILEVNGVTVDGLVQGLGLTRLDWIKIDVEGAECEVVEGARQVLQSFRPTLLIEVHGTWPRLTSLLKEVGYVIEQVAEDPVHPSYRGFIQARHPLRPQGRL
jgi:FkbM family methyltransferase